MERHVIFFDLDGTLYRTHLTALPPLYALCGEYGIRLSKEDESLLLCTTARALLEKVAPHMLEETKINFCQELKSLEIEEVRKHGSLFDGVLELLSKLKAAGYLLVICRNGQQRVILIPLVDKCGIRTYFDVVLPE